MDDYLVEWEISLVTWRKKNTSGRFVDRCIYNHIIQKHFFDTESLVKHVKVILSIYLTCIYYNPTFFLLQPECFINWER